MALALVALAAVAADATTGDDVATRLVLDGRLDEYAADEWVLDATTLPPERAGDSAWGSDNDIARAAVTWDANYLYIGIACVTLDSRLFLFIDHTGGGVTDMRASGEYRRVIDFAASGQRPFRPDVLVAARPASVTVEAVRLGGGAPGRLDGVRGRFLQDGVAGGALEVAIPWSQIGPALGTVSMAAVVTGEVGSGAGDVAPDPYGAPTASRSEAVTVDRVLALEVDADGDGVGDPGVSPREVVAVASAGLPSRQGGSAVSVAVDVKSFVPDDGETVAVTIAGAGEGEGAYFVSARVYRRDGELVRVLLADERHNPRARVDTAWDGTDRWGRIVPGGIYIVSVTWGNAPGERTGVRNVAVGVVR